MRKYCECFLCFHVSTIVSYLQMKPLDMRHYSGFSLNFRIRRHYNVFLFISRYRYQAEMCLIVLICYLFHRKNVCFLKRNSAAELCTVLHAAQFWPKA